MNFKLWLESRAQLYSWLDPEGNAFPVGNQGHDTTAYQILKNELPPNKSYEALSLLMKRGWQRINYIGRELIASNYEGIIVNRKQKRTLIDLAHEYEFNTSEFDNGVSNNSIIWSRT